MNKKEILKIFIYLNIVLALIGIIIATIPLIILSAIAIPLFFFTPGNGNLAVFTWAVSIILIYVMWVSIIKLRENIKRNEIENKHILLCVTNFLITILLIYAIHKTL